MDRATARSRHGYMIMYEGSPVIWKSQLQIEVALSSTQSEYAGLSYARREAIPSVLKEMEGHGINVGNPKAKVHCKVFEDNSGALEMVRIHKFRPRTKHLNVKSHHFWSYVDRGEIIIHPIPTTEQLADYLMKPLPQEPFEHLRKKVLEWQEIPANICAWEGVLKVWDDHPASSRDPTLTTEALHNFGCPLHELF